MRKVVTIPKDRNPFIVIVNGVEYKYPAGATIEVPDSVADVIEKYEGAKPKPDPNPAPGGNSGSSVQTDWNQTDPSAADFIKNKPFGDSPTGGDTLYWDGNTEGLVDVGGIGCLVSDKLPTMSDLANGGVIVGTMFDGSTVSIQFTASEVIDVDGDGSFITINDAVNVFNHESIHGVALMKSKTGYISSFTINGYTGFPVTKKMEEKYLPGAVILYADAENYLYATADTSDTSKRMTRAELMDAVYSGRTVYCFLDGVAYCALLNFVDVVEFAVANFDDGEGKMSFFSAEYVPEG